MTFVKLSIRLRSEKVVDEVIRNTDEEIDRKRRNLSMHKFNLSVPHPMSYDVLTIRKE